MIKASAGGDGKGTRIAWNDKEAMWELDKTSFSSTELIEIRWLYQARATESPRPRLLWVLVITVFWSKSSSTTQDTSKFKFDTFLSLQLQKYHLWPSEFHLDSRWQTWKQALPERKRVLNSKKKPKKSLKKLSALSWTPRRGLNRRESRTWPLVYWWPWTENLSTQVAK